MVKFEVQHSEQIGGSQGHGIRRTFVNVLVNGCVGAGLGAVGAYVLTQGDYFAVQVGKECIGNSACREMLTNQFVLKEMFLLATGGAISAQVVTGVQLLGRVVFGQLRST